MKNLGRKNNQATPAQVNFFNQGRLQDEVDSLRKTNERLYQKIEDVDAQVHKLNENEQKLKQQVQTAVALVRKERTEKQGIIQKLMDVVASRNSLRGKFANMVAQRNKAFQAYKAATEKLVQLNQRVTAIQQDYDQDMTELAAAYKLMSPEQRQKMPPQLRNLLDQIEQDYKE